MQQVAFGCMLAGDLKIKKAVKKPQQRQSPLE
jgi:hypothetical protein